MNKCDYSIEEFLRRELSILDCHLISRSDLAGVERAILYFVPSGQYSVNELKTQLAKAFPENRMPDFWVPITQKSGQFSGEGNNLLSKTWLVHIPAADGASLDRHR